MPATDAEEGNSSPIPLWLTIVVCLAATLLVVGAVVGLLHPAMLVGSGDPMNGAVRVYADYFASRNLALALTLLAALWLRARTVLSLLLGLFALIQFIDAGLDCFSGRWTVVPGVLFIGVVVLFCSYRLSALPFSRTDDSKARS